MRLSRIAITALSTLTILIGAPLTSAIAGGTGQLPVPAKVDCSKLPAPHMTEQCNNFVALPPVQNVKIVLARFHWDVSGTATDEIDKFSRTNNGRDLRLTFRIKPKSIVAQYAYNVPRSSDGYGEDVVPMKGKPGKTSYSFVSPRGTYVQFVYAEFAPIPQNLGSASGSPCLNSCV